MTKRVVILDEFGKEVKEFKFPDTVVETASNKKYYFVNETGYVLEVIPENVDPTLELVKCPNTLQPTDERIEFEIQYKPTMEHLKVSESLFGFKFRVL